MTSTWQVSWSKDGSLKHRQESAPMLRESDARTLAGEKKTGNRSVTILRADDTGINAGKFFLHQIIK